MKIKQLLAVTSLLVLFTLAGCEAQKPLAEGVVAPVVAKAPVEPVAQPVLAVDPIFEAPKADYQHCKKHLDKKAKACVKHCEKDLLAAHSCPKHMSKHHDKKSKACIKHCSKEAAAATK